MEPLELFVVRNRDGQYFRAKGRSGYGVTWTDDLAKARLYTKIGQARSRVTYFTSRWPEYGVPEIVRLLATVSGEVSGEKERIQKVLKAKEVSRQTYVKRCAQSRLEYARRELEQAQARLRALQTLVGGEGVQ